MRVGPQMREQSPFLALFFFFFFFTESANWYSSITKGTTKMPGGMWGKRAAGAISRPSSSDPPLPQSFLFWELLRSEPLSRLSTVKRNGSTIPIMGAIHIVQLFTHCHPSHPYILCILLHSWDSFQLHQLGQAYDILQVLTPKFPTDTH